jgi:hypothetical protein
VFPSRLRGTLERVRSRITDKQPYRCHQCGWRQWLIIEIVTPHADVTPDDLRTGRRAQSIPATEFDPLDPTRP